MAIPLNTSLLNALGSLWGLAKVTISNLMKKFDRDGLFWDYIAIFMIKNRIKSAKHLLASM